MAKVKHRFSEILQVWLRRRVELTVVGDVHRLQVLKLLQVELGHLVVDHLANGEVAGEYLKQHERRLDAVDGALQGQDDRRLVDKQE